MLILIVDSVISIFKWKKRKKNIKKMFDLDVDSGHFHF